jgi:starch phosphorylase
VFAPIWDVFMTHGDRYRHLADVSPCAGTQEKFAELHVQPEAWARKTTLNVNHSGKFSSDRTLVVYAAAI